MAKTIKGINVVIGSDVTPLGKALQDVNKHSKDIATELRKVETALKFNPKDTELLAQKQKLLGDQVAVTREKLDRLKAAQEDVNEQFKKGEISEEQYRAFQREIIETESKLKHFEKQLRETGMTAEQLGKKMKDAGKKMTDVGKQLSMKVTAPIAGLGAVVAKTGMDFEAAMSEVGAISGATGEDLKALEDMAKEMGATTKFSASEAAEGLKFMAMAGWDTQQQLDGLPGVLSLAAASGEALGTVSDIVTDAMTAFGMEAARAGEFADTLAAAASSSNTNVSMLGESFKNVAPVAGALGFEAKDTAIALGLMANAGIKGGQAGTSMRSILTRLVKPTKESGTAMDQLGISLTDSEGEMKSLEAVMGDLRGAFKDLDPDQKAFYAAQIAGQQGMSGLLAIVNAAEGDFNDLSSAINNSTGEAERMAKEMQDNLQGRLTELKSAVEGAALQLYDAMLPALEKVVAVVQKAVDWFANLSPEVKQTIVVIAGIAAAVGPVLVILGTLVSSIGTIIGAFGAVSAAITAAGGAAGVLSGALAVLTGPIGLTVAAVAGLVAGGVALVKHLRSDAIPAVNVFSEEVSESTEKVVGAYLDLDEEATKALNSLSWGQQEITEEMASQLLETYDTMHDQVLTATDERHSEELGQLEDLFASTKTMTKEEQAEALKKLKEHHESERKTVDDGKKRIEEILQTAAEENRAITEDEHEEILAIQEQMRDDAIRVMSESEAEQKAILEGLRIEAEKITALQAADVAKNAIEQRDAVVAEAEEQYKETLAAIIRQRDEAGTITAEQADKLIEEATRQKEETILNAEEMHNRIIEEAQAQAGEHAVWVDWETGENLSKWDVFKRSVGETWDAMKIKVGEVWENIRKVTQEKWDAAKEAVKSAVNGIIGFINKFIQAWNKIKLKVPEVNIPLVGKVGGWEVGVPKIPEIPMLAKGGIVTKEMLAVVGEAGPEAVIPLRDLKKVLSDVVGKEPGAGDIYQTVNVHSPKPLTPYETARQVKNASRALALEW